MTLRVVLNGTKTNPWAMYGLTQNPFPQIADYEVQNRVIRMQSLGGPPIPEATAKDYIRQTLRGWSEEFITLCQAQYKAGKLVRFEAKF